MLSVKKCRKEGCNLSYKEELNDFLKESKTKIQKLINDHEAYRRDYNDRLNLNEMIQMIGVLSIMTCFAALLIQEITFLILHINVGSKGMVGIAFLITVIVDSIFVKKTYKFYRSKKTISPEKHFNEQWSKLYNQLIIRKPNFETPTDTQMLNEMAQYDCKRKFFNDTFNYFNEKYPNHSLYATTLFHLWLTENFQTLNIQILNNLIKEINLQIKDYDYAELISIETKSDENVKNIKKTDAALIPFDEYIKQLNDHKEEVAKTKEQKALIQNLIKTIDANIQKIENLKQQTALIVRLNPNQDKNIQQKIQPIIQKHQEKAKNIYENTFQLILETLDIITQYEYEGVDIDVNESFRKILENYKEL